MSTYTGSAKLTYDGSTHDVMLSLDLQDYCLVAEHPAETPPFKYVGDWTRLSSFDFRLSDIDIKTPNGVLTAHELGDLLLLSYNPGAHSVYDSLLNRSLGRSSRDAGIVAIKLIPKHGLAVFDHSPASGTLNELLYVTNWPQLGPFECKAEEISYTVFANRPDLVVQAKQSLWKKEQRFRLALSLLQGAPVSLLASYEKGKARLNLVRPREYQSSHRFYGADHKDAPEAFRCVLHFVMGLSDREFLHWEKAAAFLLEGKASYAVGDVRATNLFVFIEMFDRSRTLSGRPVSDMLAVALSDGKFLCEVRNKLIHERYNLEEAIREADTGLKQSDPAYDLEWFDITGKEQRPVVSFLRRLCERLNRYVAKQVGWNGTWNNYNLPV